jgi:hypothetical protein
MTLVEEEAPANYVPAAAVTRMGRALFGITGRKGCAGGSASLVLNTPAQPGGCAENCWA